MFQSVERRSGRTRPSPSSRFVRNRMSRVVRDDRMRATLGQGARSVFRSFEKTTVVDNWQLEADADAAHRK